MTSDYPQPYPPQGPPEVPLAPPTPPVPPRTDTLAIVGLVLAVLFFPVGLVLSIIALRRAKKQGTGRGLAITGVVVGSVVGLGAIVVTVAIVLFARLISGPADAASELVNSYWTGSCQDYQDNSTSAFQESAGFDGCSDFESQAATFRDNAKDYSFTVTSTDISNDTAVVKGRQVYVDAASGEKNKRYVSIHLVHQDGDWLVESAE